MASPPLWLFALELNRFAPADDAADALSGSLSAIEAGAWELSPYEGPALQPEVGLALGRVDLWLLPAASFRREQATSEDGREATVRTSALRLGARAELHLSPMQIDTLRLGLLGAVSGARATLDGELVARADPTLEIAPSIGVFAPLSASWTLGARASWPVLIRDADLSHGLSGALALEWRGPGSR